MTIANWVRELSGTDPAVSLREAYSSKAEWEQIVAREGSLIALVGRLAIAAGLTEVAVSRLGDIGVVEVPKVGLAAAICAGRQWALKLDAGLMIGLPRVVQAWGLR